MTSTKRIVRWETYERDKNNLLVSKWQNHYIVLNLGTGKGKSKKAHEVRQYKVSKDEAGNVSCTCDDFLKNNSVCKHQLAVWVKARTEKKQQNEERKARVLQAVSKW
jgi:hypothetical protein